MVLLHVREAAEVLSLHRSWVKQLLLPQWCSAITGMDCEHLITDSLFSICEIVTE